MFSPRFGKMVVLEVVLVMGFIFTLWQHSHHDAATTTFDEGLLLWSHHSPLYIVIVCCASKVGAAVISSSKRLREKFKRKWGINWMRKTTNGKIV